MRGPGQPVDVPATGQRLPISFTSSGGLRSLVLTIDYDPRLLDISGATPAAGLPAGSDVRFASAPRDAGGQRARISVILPGQTTLAAGTVRLVDLVAHVPDSAPYGAKHVLDLSVESIDGGAPVAGTVIDDDALHLVGYLGDTSGNAAYTTLDGQQIQRVLVKLDTGFAAWPNVDPLLIADINGSGTLTSLDASRVLQEVSYLTGASAIDRPEIPPIPAGIGPIHFAGPDPLVDIPVDAMADPGEVVTVPVRIDTAAGLESLQVRVAYDASRFELLAVRRGSVTGDFGWLVSGQQPGQLTVDMSRLAALADGTGTLLDIDLRVRADAMPGVSPSDLQYASLNDGRLTLGVLPVLGNDETDGRITVGGRVTSGTAQPAAALTPDDPPHAGPVLLAGWPIAQPGGRQAAVVPVIDLGGSFSVPLAVEQAIVADSRNKPWLKDYLGNGGQTRKASPNSALKVTIPVSAATVRPLSSSVLARS
ncbi:MAG: hypothetical protein IPJ27_13240 [Candidatus Accumulibacter sp.]|uniref:Cohesin domain-containing protein n=1 Tax=Candidatus Accumulibacter proximus TaxID=2954385 RepID=A0A935Q038_9PROT|nr:hypothetical protein [Candidatus Accumulibacter proximus]